MTRHRPMLALATGLLLFAYALGTPVVIEVADAVVQDPVLTQSVTTDWIERTRPVPKGLRSRPSLRCASVLLVDNVTGEILYSRKMDEVRPIASLTKLLTAMVFLESGTDLTQTAVITPQDASNSSKSHLRRGEELTLRDLLYAALVSSDNRAARALARSAGMSPDDFIARMNAKAHEIGMDSTCIVEPTGLSELNVSTAHDCAILINIALQNHLIREVSTTSEVTVQPVNRRRTHRLVNTNRLLRYGYHFMGSKTGYISEAGWCVAARGFSQQGHDVTAVILGAPTNGHRFRSLRNALQWAYAFPRGESPQS